MSVQSVVREVHTAGLPPELPFLFARCFENEYYEYYHMNEVSSRCIANLQQLVLTDFNDL